MKAASFAAFLLAPALAVAAEIGPAAAWEPPAGAAAVLRAECASKPAADARACLLSFLKKNGASREAQDFALSLGGEAYMKRFEERGRVDLALTRYPFRADANDAVLLVNGEPALVDVSDPALLAPLQADPRLAALRREAPEAALWADDPGTPGVKARVGGGQRFVFAFPARDCRACAALATGFVAYDFDADGRFIGAKMVGLRRAAAFSIAGEVQAGKVFEAPIGSDMVFRLEPFPEGWTIAVKDKFGKDYCAIATLPFQGPNDLVIYGWHFLKRDDGVLGKSRNFRCVRTAIEYDAASKALDKVLWDANAPSSEIEAARKEQERLISAARPGRLTINDVKLGGAPGDQAPPIAALKFKFELFPAPGER